MKENSKIAEASITLIISGVSGESLDMDDLSAQLQLTPTRVIRKGDVVGRIPAPLLAGDDQWMYIKKLSETYDTDVEMNDLLIHLNGVRENIQKISQKYSLTLQLYVKSDHAHMSYRLMPETLGHLMAVGIPLEISSFSWGGL